MSMFNSCRRPLSALLLAIAVPTFAADKTKAKTVEDTPSAVEQSQPATENIDLAMYQRIREEGIEHSRIMQYASALTDDIGPRLTGSPNMAKANAWTRDQLTAMGCVNAHLEDWGDFGMGWQQLNTWVRMTSPDTAVFIAQATPWSPATNGPVSGDVVAVNIQSDKDFDQYKGKLAGKIVLLGEMREVPPVDQALFERYSDKELEEMASYQANDRAGRDMQARLRTYMQRYKLADQIADFLAEEKAAGVIRPSRDAKNGGGSGGTIFDDNGAALGRQPYLADHKVKVPVVVMAIESYGRVSRLLEAHVPVTIEMNVETKFTGDHEHGFDTVAEIPGTDPKLKDEVVMVGGHLDSWIAGTGATDNGAGSIVAMEVMRILKALDVHPRRTIRIALWSGEEEGLFGSRGYVKQHFGFASPLNTPDQAALPEFMRKTGPLDLKPEQKLISGYFNVDNGSGKVRGVYLQGNAAVAPIFAQWIAPLKDLGVTTLTMRNTGGTDHLSFDAVGIPGFQFIQDPLDYESRTHHSNQDVYERLQPGDLKQIATVEAIFVYNTAMREQMLPRKPLPHPELRDQQNAPLPNLFPGAVPPADEKK
ncbi:M20/M25/M40 family metallo-hydrolase [Acidobacterium sp. S8]|uniref:M20/M25/M40 family metallo-hydrolase n=1 Tax=Acidobacterium sp. S8 TaxID=1641854 RepID=UPI00131D257C|nr:M20/M25/M40 family metallo-hydrolase [Acidobacterium sp. S8]